MSRRWGEFSETFQEMAGQNGDMRLAQVHQPALQQPGQVMLHVFEHHVDRVPAPRPLLLSVSIDTGLEETRK